MSERHRELGPKRLRVAVLTVSDTRAAAMEEGRDEDISGKLIEQSLRRAGHQTTRRIVPDDARKISAAVRAFVGDPAINVVITTGGTGVASRDVTIETLQPLFEKELPGFGEVLRSFGYKIVGTQALLTRATAGVIKRKPVFCLPGAPNAVKVAMRLITPELGHVVKHARE